MLYQDPLDFPPLTVLENFMLGQTRGVADQRRYWKEKFEPLNAHFNFNLKADQQVQTLTIGERQQLEILRLLALGISTLILDEPTTGISSLQKETLFAALRKLAAEGKTVILVSHKLEDTDALCDRVTVLRQGIVSGEMGKPFVTHRLLEMMFDRLPHSPERAAAHPGEPILEMREVSASGGRTGLSKCTTVIRKGEVVGLAGLEGSGQGVFLRLAGGLAPPTRGYIRLMGNPMHHRDHHAFKSAGVAFLPAGRLEEGLIRGLTVAEHFALQDTRRGFLVRWAAAFQKADRKIRKFRIFGRSSSVVESLSGGNQQRLLLSLLPRQPNLLLLESPTRGLDLESALWVWQYLQAYCAQGSGIVFSSSELDEIVMMADRILVFFDGRIIKDAKANEISVQELGSAIAGKV
jgi:ABC-type uncharacterized transport system ATPase subunit